jgi:hypothetical protein
MDWRLELWVATALRMTEERAIRAFAEQKLPLAISTREMEGMGVFGAEYEAQFVCDSFLDARVALDGQQVAALLPEFLGPGANAKGFVRVPLQKVEGCAFGFYLAWNPRLLRLNPHATKRRDWLAEVLAG